MEEATINRVRVTCVAGPWLDDECVRVIDLPEHANLYDLHVAIQDAVDFDEEFPFHFFTALAPEAARMMIPEGLQPDVDPADFDPDVYEDFPVFAHVKANAKRSLFYVFGSEYDDWIFKIQHTGTSHAPVEGEFYPLVCDALSIGPNPEQYGSGFDDFAEDEAAFRPRPRVGGGADFDRDEDPDADDSVGGFFGIFDDDDEDEAEDDEAEDAFDGDFLDDEDDDDARW